MTTINLRWKASLSASSLHALLCLQEGLPRVKGSLAEILLKPSDNFVQTLQKLDWDGNNLLELLVCLSAEYENNRQLAEIALSRLFGNSAVTEEKVITLSAAISGMEALVLTRRPDLVDELALRARPLHEQWESRGPGLLRRLAQLTETAFVAEMAEVVLVTPFVGGHGRAYPRSNRVILEGVLANHHADLPEVLRLAWLLGQLQADAPLYAEPIAPERLQSLAELATVPAVLAAAESVEWAKCDLATIKQALECWCFVGNRSLALAEKLLHWWQTYEQGNSSWQVVWRALDKLLGAS